MNFSWKTIVAVLLIAISTVLGFLAKTPILVTASIVGIVGGTTLAISEQALSGWKQIVYLIGTIGGTVLFSLSIYSNAVIGEIASAVLLIVFVIFGIAVGDTKKE